MMSDPNIVDAVILEKLSPEELKKLLEALSEYEQDASEALDRVRQQIDKIKGLIG